MLDRLRAKLEPALPVTLVHGEATRTTLDDACVDVAFLANVWHELDDLPTALAEISRSRLAILDWRPQGSEDEPMPPRDHRVAADDVVRASQAAGGARDLPPSSGRAITSCSRRATPRSSGRSARSGRSPGRSTARNATARRRVRCAIGPATRE